MEVSTSEKTTDRKLPAKDHHYHGQKKSKKNDKEESVPGQNGRTLDDDRSAWSHDAELDCMHSGRKYAV